MMFIIWIMSWKPCQFCWNISVYFDCWDFDILFVALNMFRELFSLLSRLSLLFWSFFVIFFDIFAVVSVVKNCFFNDNKNYFEKIRDHLKILFNSKLLMMFKPLWFRCCRDLNDKLTMMLFIISKNFWKKNFVWKFDKKNFAIINCVFVENFNI